MFFKKCALGDVWQPEGLETILRRATEWEGCSERTETHGEVLQNKYHRENVKLFFHDAFFHWESIHELKEQRQDDDV